MGSKRKRHQKKVEERAVRASLDDMERRGTLLDVHETFEEIRRAVDAGDGRRARILRWAVYESARRKMLGFRGGVQ